MKLPKELERPQKKPDTWISASYMLKPEMLGTLKEKGVETRIKYNSKPKDYILEVREARDELGVLHVTHLIDKSELVNCADKFSDTVDILVRRMTVMLLAKMEVST